MLYIYALTIDKRAIAIDGSLTEPEFPIERVFLRSQMCSVWATKIKEATYLSYRIVHSYGIERVCYTLVNIVSTIQAEWTLIIDVFGAADPILLQFYLKRPQYQNTLIILKYCATFSILKSDFKRLYNFIFNLDQRKIQPSTFILHLELFILIIVMSVGTTKIRK